MATLKISDRDEVLRRVLAETFTPRFADIQKQIQAALRANLAAEHPQFIKLAKDPESRKYLATTNVRNFYFIDGEESHIAASPCYGKWAEIPSGGYCHLDRNTHCGISDSDTAVPCSMSKFKITDRKMVKAYKTVWADYVAARDKLVSLLNSYTMREKFTGDFPEFAKYLPALPTKTRLPAIIVKDVRAELSKLGIPQK